MLTQTIRNNNKHFRTANIVDSGIINFHLDSEEVAPALGALPDGASRAYYLPWAENTGFYIDLPNPPTANDPKIFLTANLSGCCVGIQNFGAFIRIRHYNLYSDNNPVFSRDDLFRYGANVSWLLPLNRYQGAAINGAYFYENAALMTEAAFWGEYLAGRWCFYYQNGNYDVNIQQMAYL